MSLRYGADLGRSRLVFRMSTYQDYFAPQIEPTVPYYWKDWTIIRQPSKETNESGKDERPGQQSEAVSADATTVPQEPALPEIESGISLENPDSQSIKAENNSQSDSVYIFNRWCALHLSVRSNGWLKYMMDRNVSTLYSSGKPVLADSESPGTG